MQEPIKPNKDTLYANKKTVDNSSAYKTANWNEKEIKDIDFLWDPYFAFGKVTEVYGDPGVGKTRLAMKILALASRGLPMPFCDGDVTDPLKVMCLSREDDVYDTLMPMFISFGGDTDKVVSIDENDVPLTLNDNRIEMAVRNEGIKVMVIDSLTSFTDSSVDMNRGNEMCESLDYIKTIANKYSCAVILIHHTNKDTKGPLQNRASGSRTITSQIRTVLLVANYPEGGENSHVLVPIKCNLRKTETAIVFDVDDDLTFKEQIGCNEHLKQKLQIDSPKTHSTATQKAEILIEKALKYGPVKAVEMIELAKKNGIGERTLMTAKSKMHIKSFKQNCCWWWQLNDVCDSKKEIIDFEPDTFEPPLANPFN